MCRQSFGGFVPSLVSLFIRFLVHSFSVCSGSLCARHYAGGEKEPKEKYTLPISPRPSHSVD